MPRPRKCRKICRLPDNDGFEPLHGREEHTPIVINVDEYETIRLIDREGFSQEECGKYMSIARTTVQKIYANARKKIADALVEGLPLQIAGGDYALCDGNCKAYGCRKCFQQKNTKIPELPKKENVLRVAVAYEKGEIYQHFGHTEEFKIFDMEEGMIISSEVVDSSPTGHGALGGFLKGLKVDAVICGGIGEGAKMVLKEEGIKLYGGVKGNADEAVAALLNGTLDYDPDIKYSHHKGDECNSCASKCSDKGD